MIMFYESTFGKSGAKSIIGEVRSGPKLREQPCRRAASEAIIGA